MALAELDRLLPLTEPERLPRLAALRARDPLLAADVAGLLDEQRALRAEHFLEDDAFGRWADERPKDS
jgi:hypothetical protein